MTARSRLAPTPRQDAMERLIGAAGLVRSLVLERAEIREAGDREALRVHDAQIGEARVALRDAETALSEFCDVREVRPWQNV